MKRTRERGQWVPERLGWKLTLLLFFPAVWIHMNSGCMCPTGVIQEQSLIGADLIIGPRVLVAVVRGERTSTWVLYATLLTFLPILAMTIIALGPDIRYF